MRENVWLEMNRTATHFLLIESSPRTNVGEIEENDERKKISHFYGEVH